MSRCVLERGKAEWSDVVELTWFYGLDELDAFLAALKADGYVVEWYGEREGDHPMALASKEDLSPEEAPRGPIVDWHESLGFEVGGRVVMIGRHEGRWFRTNAMVAVTMEDSPGGDEVLGSLLGQVPAEVRAEWLAELEAGGGDESAAADDAAKQPKEDGSG